MMPDHLPVTESEPTALPTTLPPKPANELDPATLPPPFEGVTVLPGGPSGFLAGDVQIPGYEILGKLGEGGMGVVYKARHLGLNRLVALKMIRAGHASDDMLKRFQAEAEAVAKLQHPNIVQIYDINQHRGCPFFALEYIEGGSLDKLLAGTPQPPDEAARLVATLAEAMHAAHQQKIIHRDLKPANVLLSGGRKSPESTPALSGGLRPPLSDVAPKITDFGLAKQLDADSGQTKTGAIMGTPSFIATS